MTYKQALKASTGRVSKCAGDPELAVTVRTLAMAHAIDPESTYSAAKKRGLTASDVRKMPPIDLAFLGFE